MTVVLATLALNSSSAGANSCAFPVDVLRGSSSAFEARITSATARDADGAVVYSLDTVRGESQLPDDIVVVAKPDDGVSGASFRAGQSYWFHPDETVGNEARVEACNRMAQIRSPTTKDGRWHGQCLPPCLPSS